MEDLPHHLVLDILSRLDSPTLARTRLVSKTLNYLSRHVTTVSLYWTLPRYLLHLQSPQNLRLTPFKSALKTAILGRSRVESISVGIDCSMAADADYDDAEDGDDMYLTDNGFVEEWVGRISGDLKVLKISDFWVQSCWRRSEILALLSLSCHKLSELELKNSWLSVEGLMPLPSLTSLTLEFVRLDDDDLENINTCFPHLQVLNLRGVGGLREPQIVLAHLKTCQWTVSNVPQSLTIIAPNLVKLKLKCKQPRSLILETPMLSDFELSIVQSEYCRVKSLVDLRSLKLESPLLGNVISCFSCCKTVEKLVMDANLSEDVRETASPSLQMLFKCFPNVSCLTVGPGVWLGFESWYRAGGWECDVKVDRLKEFTACVLLSEIDVAVRLMALVLDKCNNLSDVTILVHQNVDSTWLNNLMLRCMACWPRMRWKCGMYREVGRGSAPSDGWEVVWKKQACRRDLSEWMIWCAGIAPASPPSNSIQTNV